MKSPEDVRSTLCSELRPASQADLLPRLRTVANVALNLYGT